MTNYQKDESIKVSVYCMAYNHAPYIKSALDGFVNQKTSFKYEVFVHDDASTDGTAEIIKEYANKYPDIIKPVLETENQYSKGVIVLNQILFPMMSGKYIGICEGDDYWCDDRKLQLEYDFLEKHLDYSACTHNSLIHDCKTGKERPMFGLKDKEILFDEVAKGGLSCYHISSVLYRREYAIRPKCFYEPEGGDFPQSLYLTSSGRVHYYGRVMSVYRHGTKGSWSSRIFGNPQKFEELMKHEVLMLQNIDEYLDHKKHEVIEQAIVGCYYRADIANRRYKAVLKDEKYRKFIKDMGLRRKVGLYLNAYCPLIMDVYHRIIRK